MYSLGRNVKHDPRSRHYPAKVADTRRPVSWQHFGPVLNQGKLGSCTGNALAQALNTGPLHQDGARLLVESDAVRIYSRATQLDDAPGEYPPTDTGSNGLSVCRAAQEFGLIKSYAHAFTVDHALGALQLQPFLFGTHWYRDMFTPDADGFVHPGGELAGGHEICCVADSGSYLELLNSWGDEWGVEGRFRLTYADFEALMNDQGDVTVPEDNPEERF